MATRESNIPPGILHKLERLADEERRTYLQERIGHYEHMRNRLEDRAEGMAKTWLKGQVEWMDIVLADLREYRTNLDK